MSAESDPAPPHAWSITESTGETFTALRTPPATLAEVQADHHGALVEPRPDPPPGSALHPDDQALADALLCIWGESDPGIRQEWFERLAGNPDWLRPMYADAVLLGLASYDTAPETDETATPGAVCACCEHFEPDRINPSGGLGRCREDAPASRRPGSLWPWPDAEIRCAAFAPAHQPRNESPT